MNDQEIERASVRLGKWILGVLGGAAAATALVFGTTAFLYARIPAAYTFLAALFLEIFLVYRFSRCAPAPAPLAPLLTGWAFVLGGITLDLAMTVAKTPDLEQENNAVARAFLDSGYPLWHVRLFAFAAQAGLAVLACLTWTAFLRHRGPLVALTRALGPRTFREFTNAAVRGVLRPKPLLSRSGIALPRFNWYRVTCLALVAWFGSHLYRWYCGLEWLDLVPPQNLLLKVVAASAGIAYFYLWLWTQYQQSKGVGAEESAQ
jgi:hypothetical protein